MNARVKTILGIFIFIAFLGIAYFAYSSLSDNYIPNNDLQFDDNNSIQGEVISLAPDFTVYDAQGNEVRLSDFFGTPIVLNFWASWCSPCKNEMPHFNEAYAEFKDEVVFLMVDVVDGQRETQEKGQKYVEDEGFNLPIYFDNEQEAANTYELMYIPTTILISAEGNIAGVYKGTIDKETLISGIVLIK
ncbi:MAG: TlpA family protein disulfide reductase [Vulcanibacillus sp.]